LRHSNDKKFKWFIVIDIDCKVQKIQEFGGGGGGEE